MSQRSLVRLLSLAPAAVLLSGLFTVWGGPLAGPVAADGLAGFGPGTVVAWGYNYHGESTVPAGLSGVVAIAAGGDFSLALKSDGTVVAWGYNYHGETTVPVGLSGVTAIAAGDGFSLALKSDGTVVAWGSNYHGETTVPVGVSGVTAIAGGELHSLALKSDGTVVAWGSNGYGETTVPAGLSGVVAIAAGGYDSLALKSDGTVVAWGYNADGDADVPAGLSGVVAIAAGGDHSLALKSDGTVVAWGNNPYGETTVPAGLSGVKAIAAGDSDSLALKSDGTVVAWGHNTYGETTVPVGLSGVGAIAAGGGFSLALGADVSAPTDASVSIDGGQTYSSSASTTLTLAATDDVGVRQMRLSQDSGFAGASWVPYATSAAFTISDGDGSTQTVYAQFRDFSGNTSDIASDSIVLDTVAPISAVSTLPTDESTSSFTVAWSGSDATSGVATYDVQVRDDGITPPGGSGTPGTWTAWKTGTSATTANFTGSGGHRYCFRVRATDAAGNTEAYPATPDACTRVISTVAPTGGSVVIDSSAAATNSTAVEITLAASDNVAVSSMRISEDPTFAGLAWQAFATDVPFQLSDGDGTHTVYAEFRDPDGNVSAVASDSILLDTVAPSSAVTALPASETYPSFAVSWSGSDATSGVATYDVQVRDDGLTAPGGSGTPGTWHSFVSATTGTSALFTGAAAHRYCFRVRATDAAGNIETYPSVPDTCTRVADRTAPTLAHITIAGGAAYTDVPAVSLALSASDNIGVTAMRVSEDSGFAGAAWQPYATSLPWTFAGDGTHTVYAQFGDADGNSSPVVSDSIVLDTVAPGGTIVLNGGALSTTSTTVNATLAATDDRSGVAACRLSNDGTSWSGWTTFGGNGTVGWSLASGDGTHTVYAQFEDAAGNVSLPASDAIDLDSGVYSSDYNVSINAGADFTNTQNAVLDLYAPAGTTQIEISNDGGFGGAVWEPYVAHKAWTLGNPNGQIVTRVVYVKFRSAAGRTSAAILDDIVIDPTAPTSALSSPTLATTASAVSPAAAKSATINTTATDQANGSGVALMELSTRSDFAGAVWQPYKTSVAFPYDTRAATTVYVRFMDGAGNVSAAYRKTLASPASPTVPTQIAPMSGTLATSLRPTFAWSSLAGGPKYELEVSTSASFGTLALHITTAATSWVPTSALPASKPLYWRVRVAAGAWSPTWSFTTPAGDPPKLSSPASGATLTTLAPTLTWSAVSGATSYQVQLGRDSAFLAGVHTYSSTKTSLHLVPLARLAHHTWRVRAMFGTKPGPWSVSRSFSTPALGQVALASPANGAALPSSGRLDWADVTGAASYRLQLCSNSTCTSLLRDLSVANSVYRPTGLTVNWYWWRVRANGPSSIVGAWSPIWLVLVKPGTPGAPTGVKATPLNHSASVSWTAPVSSGGSSIKGYTVTSSPGGKTCTTTGKTSCTVGGLTIGLTYTFTVRATNATRTGPPSNTSASITIGAATHLSVSTFNPFVAGATHSVTVKALDAYGNIATGYRGTIHFTSSDAKASLPANYKFTASDKGVHTFTLALVLRTAGSRWVRATDKTTASITGFQTVSVT